MHKPGISDQGMALRTASAPHSKTAWVNPKLMVGVKAATRQQPARKRRPRPASSAVGSAKHGGGPSPNAAVSPAFRAMSAVDEGQIAQMTVEQIGPTFKDTYGYDLDLPMVMQYVRSAHTRMIVVGERTVGYVSFVADDTGRVNIGSLVLVPEFQRKGVGKWAMSKIEEEARANGMSELEVFIQEKNARSVAFAKRLGFEASKAMDPRTIAMKKLLR